MSELFKLNKSDFAKGAVTAVFTGVVLALAGAVQQPGFDVFSIDWKLVLNASVASFIGYLGKNFTSDAQGKFLGKI